MRLKVPPREDDLMSEQLGPLEVNCDAPLYHVVEACERLGFHAPLDVRWCRVSHFLAARGNTFSRWFFGKGQPEGWTCNCGRSLPPLEPCTFTFASERKAVYYLGQCRKCWTIYWEEG